MSFYTEDTLRRRAYKVGFKIEKGFQHDDDGNVIIRKGQGHISGYQVKDLKDGSYVFDSNFEGASNYRWDIDMVEDFLKGEYEKRGIKW